MPRLPSPESLDPAQVLLMLDDPEARRRLTSWLGTRNVDEMMSFTSRDVGADAGRRRVVLLHGIMGGQLVDRRGLIDDVLWFDLPQLLYTGGLERLRLTEDGRGDATPGARLEPTRPLRIVYDLLAWHLAGVGGFRVHPLAYDWRKSIDIAAERLHAQLETLAAGDVEARFAVVAHSMGGVVTMRYATLFPEAAKRRIEQVVLMGTPLAGCFEPFQLWAGVHPTAARVERVSPNRGDIVRQVFATFPGMAELTADPRLFDSAGLLDPRAWPDLPSLARLLPRGRAWRETAGFPDFLRDRLDIVLSADFDTCVGLHRGPDGVTERHAPGDGSVPATSAWCSGARGHYAVPTHHPLLPLDHEVRSGVTALVASNGTFAGGMRKVASLEELLAPQGPTQAPGVNAVAPPAVKPRPTLVLGLPPAPPAFDTFADRAKRGEACNGDGMWLLGCDTAKPGDPTAGGRPLPPAPRGPRGPRGGRRRPSGAPAPGEPRPL